jgi:hypothetical protein
VLSFITQSGHPLGHAFSHISPYHPDLHLKHLPARVQCPSASDFAQFAHMLSPALHGLSHIGPYHLRSQAAHVPKVLTLPSKSWREFSLQCEFNPFKQKPAMSQPSSPHSIGHSRSQPRPHITLLLHSLQRFPFCAALLHLQTGATEAVEHLRSSWTLPFLTTDFMKAARLSESRAAWTRVTPSSAPKVSTRNMDTDM